MSAAARVPSRWFNTIGPVVTVADLAAVLLAGLVTGALGDHEPLWPLAVAAVAAGLVARAADLHHPRLVLSIVEDLPGLLVAAAVATVILLSADQASATFTVLVLATLVLAHTLVYGTTHLLRRTGRLRRRVLIVGTGTSARRLALTLLERPELGLRPVGLVGTGRRDPLAQARGLPLPMIGRVQTLPRLMTEAQVDTVVFALPDPAGEAEAAAVEGCLAAAAGVYAVPANFYPAEAYARHPRELVGGIALVHVYRRATWAPVRAGKRLTELAVALVTLIVVLPLAAVIAALVRIESGGVLVWEPRVDEEGTPVTVPTFRTRRARWVGRPGTTWSVAISGRTRPIGYVLRRTGLVRLPELVRGQLRQVFHSRVVTAAPLGSATPARTDQPKVETGQLMG